MSDWAKDDAILGLAFAAGEIWTNGSSGERTEKAISEDNQERGRREEIVCVCVS